MGRPRNPRWPEYIDPDGANPSGLCQCGCQQPTRLANTTNREKGYVIGQPMRYLLGHRATKAEGAGTNPDGYCLCGCGERTPLAPYSHAARGYIAGTPLKYVNGHAGRVPRAKFLFEEEDRGHETPCWIWRGKYGPDGYGRSRNGLAHRESYVRFVGPIPAGLVLHHLCGQRACVRPEHLLPTSRADHRVAHRLLSQERAEEIRAATGSQREVATRFGVSQGVVWKIKHGLTYSS